MPRIRASFAALGAIAALAGCSGNGSATPVAPTPTPAATITAITVTSQPPVGLSFQLLATARFSDGTTRDVTMLATWSSSDESVIAVSPGGLAAIVGTGAADVRAAYQNVVGTLAIEFGSGAALSGRAREEAPNTPPLAGVRVEIVSGARTGTFAVSDATGAFRLPNVTGVVDVLATKPGYLPWRVANLTVDRNMTIDVTMYATPPTNSSGETATARCQDGTWSWARTVADACTANGGILYGVCPGALCAATRSVGTIR
jgi:hypothetical protein